MVQPNTALLTMTLTVFTFVLAYYLKGLRNKKLLGRTVSDECKNMLCIAFASHYLAPEHCWLHTPSCPNTIGHSKGPLTNSC